jgi:hypothetical protein
LWHVQTEDSGVNNPHIFTHLFHDGTILATKRVDYDPGCEVSVVQKLMQAQHKAMLRDLKQGLFDDKIGRFFGTPVVKEKEESTDPGGRPLTGEFDVDPKTDPSMPELPRGISSQNIPVMTPSPPPMAPRAPVQPPAQQRAGSTANVPQQMPQPSPSRPNLMPARPSIPVAASRTGASAAQQAPRAPVTGIGGRRSGSGVAHPYGGGKPTAEGVVVARPAVIVGDPSGTAPRASVSAPRQRSFTPPPPSSHPAPPPQASKTPTSDNIFGGDLISEKSLDEVILAYLSEDMNEK